MTIRMALTTPRVLWRSRLSPELQRRVAAGEAHWVTITDEHSPLHGRHLLIEGPRPPAGAHSSGRILAGHGIPRHLIEKITGATYAHHLSHVVSDRPAERQRPVATKILWEKPATYNKRKVIQVSYSGADGHRLFDADLPHYEIRQDAPGSHTYYAVEMAYEPSSVVGVRQVTWRSPSGALAEIKRRVEARAAQQGVLATTPKAPQGAAPRLRGRRAADAKQTMASKGVRHPVFVWTPYPWPGRYERREGTLVDLGHGISGVAVSSGMARYGWSVYDTRTGLELAGPGSGAAYRGPLTKVEAIAAARQEVAEHHERIREAQARHLAKYGPPPSEATHKSRREGGGGVVLRFRDVLQAVPTVRRILRKSARHTHHLDQWDYWDYDDPGEAEDRLADEWAIIDQEAEEGRAHRPGYHAKGFRRSTSDAEQMRAAEDALRKLEAIRRVLAEDVAHERAELRIRKSETRHRLPPAEQRRYLNPDGTFKGGFEGAVRYFEAQGYDHATAVKIAGKIAARKRLHKAGHPKAPPRHGDVTALPEDRRLPPGAHRTPPKGYPTDRRQYAIPEWYALPLDTPAHARNAASRFPQMREYAHLSPAAKRRIWRRIVAAERRFGIDPGPEVLAAAGLTRGPKAPR